MDLAKLIGPSAIRTLTTASSKKRIFQEAGELAESAYGLPALATVEALLERESLGPTGVGHGVALPHARVPGLDSVKGAFLKFDKPVDYGALDRLPVDLVFLLLAPEKAGVEHLESARPGVAHFAKPRHMRQAQGQRRSGDTSHGSDRNALDQSGGLSVAPGREAIHEIVALIGVADCRFHPLVVDFRQR